MCDALSEAGHRVRYLGSTVPEAHLLKMVDDISPEVVALSCSVAINLPSARSTIDALRTLSSPHLIMVGGRAASASLEAMGADIYAHDAREALARLALALP
jgi:methanogenic corrinoid protein MtbC1